MAENLNNEMEAKLLEVAGRVKALRLDMGLTVEEIARKMELTPEEYERYEEGKEDFNFTFCFKFANIAKVDIADILEGFSLPHGIRRNKARTGTPHRKTCWFRDKVPASGFKIQKQDV